MHMDVLASFPMRLLLLVSPDWGNGKARQIFSTREKQHGFCSEKDKFLCENPQTVVLRESGGVKEFKNCPDYQNMSHL